MFKRIFAQSIIILPYSVVHYAMAGRLIEGMYELTLTFIMH